MSKFKALDNIPNYFICLGSIYKGFTYNKMNKIPWKCTLQLFLN